MRVKSVERHPDYFGFRIWFEHNGVEWFKYVEDKVFQWPFASEYMQNFLNSIIEDTIARHTK